MDPVTPVGIPGEPFTEVGVQIKDTDGFEWILLCALTNGYEARSSRYKSGVAEKIVENGKRLLAELARL